MYVYFYLFVRAGAASLDALAARGGGQPRRGPLAHAPAGGAAALRPALAGAALLTFMTALASFSAPYIFGGGFRVMTTQIVATRLNGDDELAMVETVSLTLLALARAAAASGRPRRSAATAAAERARRRRRCRCAAAGCARARAVAGWGLAALLLLPHVTLLLVSLVPVGTWTVEALPPAYTSRNYLTLVQDPVRAAAAAQQPLARHRGHGRRAWRSALARALPRACAAGSGAPR